MSEIGKTTQDGDRNRKLAILAGYFAPIQGSLAVTPSNSATVVAGRKFAIVCTVAGNVKVGFTGGGTFTFPVPISTIPLIFDWAVNQVFVTGTTATATYTNLS